MNYAVMYEYAVDRNSGQFKAPFNEINNEALFTYKDTAVVTPNSASIHLFMDLLSDGAVGSGRGESLLSVMLRRARSATATSAAA
jgi:hypothetical protein